MLPSFGSILEKNHWCNRRDCLPKFDAFQKILYCILNLFYIMRNNNLVCLTNSGSFSNNELSSDFRIYKLALYQALGFRLFTDEISYEIASCSFAMPN